jgi:dienelactone hydrolase
MSDRSTIVRRFRRVLRHAVTTTTLLLGVSAVTVHAQTPAPFKPEVAVQDADYASVRRTFRTTLSRHGESPQEAPRYRPMRGATEIEYPSGALRLHAWITDHDNRGPKRPAVLFLHGGFSFGMDDWDMALPYFEAGFVVMVPMLRGENGNAGEFSFFYDEVDDVLAAATFLSREPSVDPSRIFLAGHSAGATLALLTAEATGRFRAVASFDGSPDQQLLYHGSAVKPGAHAELVIDPDDLRELQVRSPLAYASSVKSPLRLYYSTEASFLYRYPTARMVEVARAHGRDVVAAQVDGSHMSHVGAAMRQSIVFFKGFVDARTLGRMTPRTAPAVTPSLTGNTTFRLEGHPKAHRVALAGSFNGWDSRHVLCGRQGDEWVCRVDLPVGRHLYRFVVDDEWILDPGNPAREDDGQGSVNSLLVVTH